MINRNNWLLVNSYLRYRGEVDLLSPSSIRLETTWLRQLLEWADMRSFREIENIRPTFPEYMVSVNRYGQTGKLSTIYIKKVITSAKRFFLWLSKHNREYSNITAAWLDTLKPPRMETGNTDHQAVSLEYVLHLAHSPVTSSRERRIRAASVFWFLSGIRVGAFVTLPIQAVDIPKRTIYQWPSLGVHTKFKKRSITYLLEIPDLIKVIEEWDQEIRTLYPPSALWFAPLSPETGGFDPSIEHVGNYRTCRAAKDLKAWTHRLGLPYYSPHKFRHGFAVHAIKHSKDIADLKAVSQNLMHANLSITDGVYGVLSSKDVGDRIANLGHQLSSSDQSNESILRQLSDLLNQLKQQSP